VVQSFRLLVPELDQLPALALGLLPFLVLDPSLVLELVPDLVPALGQLLGL
jgi:hypothetical protein